MKVNYSQKKKHTSNFLRYPGLSGLKHMPSHLNPPGEPVLKDTETLVLTFAFSGLPSFLWKNVLSSRRPCFEASLVHHVAQVATTASGDEAVYFYTLWNPVPPF